MQAVLTIDQGTTGSTALLIGRDGSVLARAYSEFAQHYPKPGWVEHDPEEIWQVSQKVMQHAIDQSGLAADNIAALGITNQRETTVVWDRRTGQPVHRAIVWQSRQSLPVCQRLKAAGHEPLFRKRTGLLLDAYFSASKIRWILDLDPQLQQRAESGELAFGTIDSWLLWKLTGGTADAGAVHATDPTNASRSLLFDIRRREWDEELCSLLEIPTGMLPSVQSSSGVFGHCHGNSGLPTGLAIAGIAGDQQAALFGQGCWQPGQAKNTYGTGCFLLMNMGQQAPESQHGLLTTLCCDQRGQAVYALEGSVFFAGSTIQWLRDQLGIIPDAASSEDLARQVHDNQGVYLVPAFAGLGAPYWDPEARGALLGLTRGTGRPEIARAALESLAYQSRDLFDAMAADSNVPISELRVDGGACANDLLMQFQADLLGVPVQRPKLLESTALGAAGLAGLAVGFWQDATELAAAMQADRRFEPTMAQGERDALQAGWRAAVRRVRSDIATAEPAGSRSDKRQDQTAPTPEPPTGQCTIVGQHGQLLSHDGLALFWQCWLPDNPRGLILMVHGLAEHSDRNRQTAEDLARMGFAVYALDLRGHGWSQDGKRPGRVHLEDFADYLADVDALYHLARARHADLPRVILGHSMGGLISMTWALEHPERLAGAIISSPAIGPHPDAIPPAPVLWLANVLARIAPRMQLPSEFDPAVLSHDPEVVRAYVEDPLVSRGVSTGWFRAISAAMESLQARAGELRVPMLLMQSAEDKLVDPAATAAWAQAAPPEHLEFQPWPGFYHEMFNEVERDRVLARVRDWLDRLIA